MVTVGDRVDIIGFQRIITALNTRLRSHDLSTFRYGLIMKVLWDSFSVLNLVYMTVAGSIGYDYLQHRWFWSLATVLTIVMTMEIAFRVVRYICINALAPVAF